MVLEKSKCVHPRLNFGKTDLHIVYERAGASTISVLAWLFGDPTIYTTSIEVARQIVSTRGQFEKPPETTMITS